MGPVGLAPWPPLFWVPINGPYGQFQFLTGALAPPGQFNIAQGDTIIVWVCRRRN